ncbi:unnamed protein product [Arabidopsis halleri]
MHRSPYPHMDLLQHYPRLHDSHLDTSYHHKSFLYPY